jgi:hypothetical protein
VNLVPSQGGKQKEQTCGFLSQSYVLIKPGKRHTMFHSPYKAKVISVFVKTKKKNQLSLEICYCLTEK